MKGYKDSTKTQYERGGAACYAKGGSVKGAAKVSKVMGEFKSGKLHSGSKSGPEVKNPKQAVAIALSEARKAGAKVPMKKAEGGRVKMPSAGESVASGNRMSEMEARESRMMERRVPGKGAVTEREGRMVKQRAPVRDPRVPLIGDSVASGNRMSSQEAAEARAMGVFKRGGLAAMPKKC